MKNSLTEYLFRFKKFVALRYLIWGTTRKGRIIVGLTWSLCGHDSRAEPPAYKEKRLSLSMLSCPPLHIKPPILPTSPTVFSEEANLFCLIDPVILSGRNRSLAADERPSLPARSSLWGLGHSLFRRRLAVSPLSFKIINNGKPYLKIKLLL
jgi:hypothetical protein